MKKLILTFSIFSCFLFADGQSNDSIKLDSNGMCSDKFTIAEIVPDYPGGYDSFCKELFSKLSFSSNVNGKVTLTFFVNCIGKPVNFKFANGINSTVEGKFVAAIKSLKDWTPGTQMGKAIDVAVKVEFEVKNGVVSRPTKKVK